MMRVFGNMSIRMSIAGEFYSNLIQRKGAGGYQIQGSSCAIIEKINGCYNNVVGIPLFKFMKAIKGVVGKFE
jgi:predicted house-cleaning NTP pyrophosphatase (Maf/HAM1 superfamily)